MLFFFLFFCLPLYTFGSLWYKASTNSLQENAIHYNEELIQQINNNLDYYFYDIQKLTLPLLTNPLVQKLIKIDPKDQYEYFDVNTRINDELYPNVTFGRTDIYGFSLVSMKGAYFSNLSFKERAYEYIHLDTGDENYKILGISVINSTPVITVYRKIFDNFSQRPAGAIIIDITLDRLQQITNNIFLGKDGYMAIIDSNGKYIYHPNRTRWGEEISPVYTTRMEKHQGYFLMNDDNNLKRIVIFNRSKFTNLTMISEVSFDELIGKLIFIRNITVYFGFLLILFALITIVIFSLSITLPLSNLLKLMKKVEQGNLNIRASKRRDEIGNLNHGFNKMIKEIQRLIEEIQLSKLKEMEMQIKQREAMLHSMQSRINPHFLYNTLEVINAYAIVARIKPISQMTVWLSHMFRYSIRNPNQFVLLSEEIEHVTTYFKIQQERYKDLEVAMELDLLVLKQVKTLRLVVQPLVENAFIHGYEKQMLKVEYIGISGEATDGFYVIRVVDKGRGMAPEIKDAYNRAFDQMTAKQMLMRNSEPFQKIGLWNVHSRIRLFFGEPYGLTIERSDSTGTVISLKLPFE
jgi:two-component system, sensor histidine kinase YesM